MTRSVCNHADLWWEGAWPTDVADRIDASLPTFVTEEISKRTTAEIAEADKCVVSPSPTVVGNVDRC